ncbi:MAG: RNA-binding domain-containing protein [Fervidicoccaceae archaeon]
MQWKVRVEVPVRFTEDESKLLELLNRIVEPERVFVEEEASEKRLVAVSRCLSSLAKLRDLLRRERILDAARKRMLSGASEETLRVLIHKQALAGGRLSLVDHESESPLGAVRVVVYHERPLEVVDWLAPPTREGRPLWERETPQPDCAPSF